MPKRVFDDYQRVNVYLRKPQLEVRAQIANFSAFVQIATDNCIDIMAWAMLKQIDPKKYHIKHDPEKVISEFNKKFPADPLVKGKQKVWPTTSRKLPNTLS